MVKLDDVLRKSIRVVVKDSMVVFCWSAPGAGAGEYTLHLRERALPPSDRLGALTKLPADEA